MKRIRIFILTILLSASFMGSLAFADDLRDAVVKVFVAANSIDYYRPWQSKGLKASSGSGVIISGNRILTNAHVIADQTFVQVKKNSDPKKYTAEVQVIGHDCDLALLTVKDSEFFKGIKPISLGGLPKLSDSVKVFGFPQGGGKLSITEGVVSRVEVNSYAQSGRQLLTVQIDAAINPGNSGGPVIQDGKLVGIAMQALQQGQNIGYMIPVPIIKHFFEDYKDGEYNGFPLIGIEYNTTENKNLRDFYKLHDHEGGVLITKILPNSPAYEVLQEGDVVLELDGVSIGEDGTFDFRDTERLALPHLITKNQINDDISLRIVRDGKRQNVTVTLSQFVVMVPHPKQFKKPPYYIFGGLVFTVLSTDLLKSWGGRFWEKAPLDFNYYLIGTGRLNEEKRKEIVVLLNVLSDDINVGYHSYGNDVIATVNGQTFDSFKEFVLLVNKIKQEEDYTVVATEQNTQIIIGNEGIDKIDKEIIQRNNIPYQYSKDVGEWLNP